MNDAVATGERRDRPRIKLMMLRVTMLALACWLSGCAGVMTLPVYSVQEPSKWRAVNGLGNPMRHEEGETTTEVRIMGVWGVYPTIRLYVETVPKEDVALINEASLMLDRELAILPCKRVDYSPGRAVFYFSSPDFMPTEIEVRIQSLPPLILSVGREDCFWIGDSYANYIRCSEPAVSADRLRW